MIALAILVGVVALVLAVRVAFAIVEARRVEQVSASWRNEHLRGRRNG